MLLLYLIFLCMDMRIELEADYCRIQFHSQAKLLINVNNPAKDNEPNVKSLNCMNMNAKLQVQHCRIQFHAQV